MTHEEKYKAVEQAIRKACPECAPRVKHFEKHELVTYEQSWLGRVSGTATGYWLEQLPKLNFAIGEVEDNPFAQTVTVTEYRPIRLADVLEAVRRTLGEKYKTHDFHVFDSGTMATEQAGGGCAKWDLLTDDLSKAPTETISFLYSVLC